MQKLWQITKIQQTNYDKGKWFRAATAEVQSCA